MFAHMTHHLSALANGKIILILEGGYNLNSISLSMTLCTKALLGDPLPPLAPYKIPLASAMETIRNVIRSYSAYWCCIKSFDCILPKRIKPDVKDGSHLLSKLEHDARNVNDGVELNGERDTIWYTDTIVETIPKLEDEDANVNIYDELVKDTEYIPSEYGHSVGTTGTNTISKQFVYVADAPRTQTLTDSQDDGSSSKSFAAENIQRTSMSYPIQCTPLSLTKHFEDLTLTSSQKQVLSMPELSSAAGDSNTDSNPGNQAIQLQGEYIPFQYGSYPGSRSVSTFTTSISSGHSLSTTTKTTDSKS